MFNHQANWGAMFGQSVCFRSLQTKPYCLSFFSKKLGYILLVNANMAL